MGQWKNQHYANIGKKIRRKKKFDVLFFEAWKYEYSNPALGLIAEISRRYSTKKTLENILRAASYVISNKYLGIDSEKIIEIISNKQSSAESLSENLKKILNKKFKNKNLIVIIDDLDRCDVENSLQLLSIVKLFLDIENCICIAAVDFNRLQQAWKTKYGVDNLNNDGIEYLEKIFQIRIGIPIPTEKQMKQYIEKLIPKIPNELLDLFSLTGPRNPRSFKRMLNLIAYRNNILSSDTKQIASCIWTLFEEIVSNKTAIAIYDILESTSNGLTITIYKNGNNWPLIEKIINSEKKEILKNIDSKRLEWFFNISWTLVNSYRINTTKLKSDIEILYGASKEALK